MNNIITNYTFNATAKTVTLTDFTIVDVKRIRFIKNLTTNSFIYRFTDILSISSATNVVTFTVANTGMVNTDVLSIQYDTVNGSVAASTALSVALPIEQVQDFIVTGQAGQSAVGQNILLSTAGTAAFDTLNPSTGVSYRSWYLQIIPSASITSGAITFEGSNDNVTFVQMTGMDEAINTGSVASSITFSGSNNRFFSGKCSFRYVRARISTALVGATIGAITKFSSETYVPRVTLINYSQGVITTSGVFQTNIDVTSGALTTTTTSSSLTQGNALSYSVYVTVTAVSGTLPTLDVNIEESDDGINWFIVHSFPRIIANGMYRSPRLPINGTVRRYTQTVAGTSPSFTRSISRIYFQDAVPMVRQLIDRSVVLTTLNSVTPSLVITNTKNVQLIVIIDTTTTAPILQLEGSDDNGSNWYAIGTALTAVASGTVQLTVANMSSQFIRARVSTAGTATLLNSVILKAF